MNEMKLVQLSSLEKVFLTGRITDVGYKSATALKGEVFSYQIAYTNRNSELNYIRARVSVKSPIKDLITLRRVGNVPSELPAYEALFGGHDEDYISTEPGLFPDPLFPVEDSLELVDHVWRSLWVTVKIPENAKPGEYPITIEFEQDGAVSEATLLLRIIDAVLPKQKLIYTQWFHADCLYSYYKVEPFSPEHWRILENFIKTAVDNGINMILTPVFTPPLDTDFGRERPTVQLVDIEKDGDTYSFDFSNLIKWFKLCQKLGIVYFEMPHLFTQWGARFTPKIMAKEKGELKRIFGWDVPADAQEYISFLQQLIPRLIQVATDEGLEKKIYFHISDEPKPEDIDQYKKLKEKIGYLLEGFPLMDALSSYSFYKEGLTEIPVVTLDHTDEYLENNVNPLFVYNCCAQTVGVSNRFISMPSYRNRIIGSQLYKYQVQGFLHWGYNFYYAGRSREMLNPFFTTDALNSFPSGDPFSVYPGENGEPLESIHLVVFHEALQDLRAMELLESLSGRETVMKLIEAELKTPLSFKSYPRSPEYILSLREKINDAISKAGGHHF